jgi:hypothetical protein
MQAVLLTPWGHLGPISSLRALANVNRKRYTEAENDIRKAIDTAPQSAFGFRGEAER